MFKNATFRKNDNCASNYASSADAKSYQTSMEDIKCNNFILRSNIKTEKWF